MPAKCDCVGALWEAMLKLSVQGATSQQMANLGPVQQDHLRDRGTCRTPSVARLSCSTESRKSRELRLQSMPRRTISKARRGNDTEKVSSGWVG